MTENQNSRLQVLFAEAQSDLDGEAFTARVMAQTRRLRFRAVALIFATLVLVTGAWFFAPPLQEFTLLVAQGLITSLFDLGDGWLAFFLSPINNIGSLLILSVKAIRIGRKKIIGASYSY